LAVAAIIEVNTELLAAQVLWERLDLLYKRE
jgi:hypothetical protein